MTPSLQSRLTLAEYLSNTDDSCAHYEFVDGVRVEMPPESDLNTRIALRLLASLLQLVPIERLRHKDTEIVVSAGRVRLPDLLVLSEALAAALAGQSRSTILPEMPPPALVVEVVSPGKANCDRDYRYKRAEYAVRNIPEYWIIDPQAQRVTVLLLVDGLYEEQMFQGCDRIQSTVLPNLDLTAAQILQA